jgi:transposase
VKNRLRHLLSDHNADLPGLFGNSGFSPAGVRHLAGLSLPSEEQFVLDSLRGELEFHLSQLKQVDERLRKFARQAGTAESEARALLASVPGVGKVATEVILSEVGEIRRFRSQKRVASYAGLSPGFRESDGKRKNLPITKQGSKSLRWIMVEVAWTAVRTTARWRSVYENLKQRCGAKKAIVAVARRLLTVITAVLKSGKPYEHARGLPQEGSVEEQVPREKFEFVPAS